ncbi:UNVERIFIED_CONTAM: hypothetical protein NCL1_44150 [Trichonephila clavipes]
MALSGSLPQINLGVQETWINNKRKHIDVPNFHCIAKFQRHNHRAGGVAIYKNKGNTTTYATSEMDVASNITESFGFKESLNSPQ